MAASASRQPVTVSKPIPYTFDLGNLLCTDANPLPPSHAITEADLQAAARDCAQVLVNQLLTTCPITRSSDNAAVTLSLPPPTTSLPREKSVPVATPLTRWEAFARKKGIKATKTSDKIFDDETGELVRKWGYKGKNKEAENDWLVEMDNAKDDADPRTASRAERKERVRRQERKMRANEAKT